MNTLFSYLYRDADNYKAHGEFVASGVFTNTHRSLIAAHLQEGIYFIPSQLNLGIEDLQPLLQQYDMQDWDVDHPWHELDVMEMTLTEQEPTIPYSVDDVADAFATTRWKEQ